MKPVVITMPGNERMSRELVARLDLEDGAVTVRHFPDGESHVRMNLRHVNTATAAPPKVRFWNAFSRIAT